MSEESQTSTNLSSTADATAQPLGLRATNQLIGQARAELGKVISGQNSVIEEVLIAVLCQGHALLEGVPGIAKTLIVKSLGRLLGLEFQARAGYAGLDARRYSRHVDPEAGDGVVYVSRRTCIHGPG